MTSYSTEAIDNDTLKHASSMRDVRCHLTDWPRRLPREDRSIMD